MSEETVKEFLCNDGKVSWYDYFGDNWVIFSKNKDVYYSFYF